MASKEFGEYMKNLREKNGFISQRSLADRISVSNATIARIERGDTRASHETLCKIADVYGMDYKVLVVGQESLDEPREKTLNEKIRMLSKEQSELVGRYVDKLLGGKI